MAFRALPWFVVSQLSVIICRIEAVLERESGNSPLQHTPTLVFGNLAKFEFL